MQEPTARAGSQRTVWLNGISTPRLRSRAFSQPGLRDSVNVRKRRQRYLQYRSYRVMRLRDCCQVKPDCRTRPPDSLAKRVRSTMYACMSTVTIMESFQMKAQVPPPIIPPSSAMPSRFGQPRHATPRAIPDQPLLQTYHAYHSMAR